MMAQFSAAVEASGMSAEQVHRAHQAWFCGGNETGGSGELPRDMMESGQRRLGFAAFCYAMVYLAAWQGIYWLLRLLGMLDGHDRGPWSSEDTIGTVAIAGSLCLYGVLRRRTFSAVVLDRIAVTFQICAALGIALVIFSHDWPEGAVPVGLTWVTLWIAAFPGIYVPKPRYQWIGAVGSVSVTPLVFLLYYNMGVQPPPAWSTAALIAADCIAALMALGTGKLIYVMGREVKQARQMGSYLLESLIGKGGMGEVWQARHQLLARPAAVKLIRPERLAGSGGADNALRRFEREAQATAMLRSPHTIELYDFGVAESGSFYYVMELLDGLDLGNLVDRFGPVEPSRAVHLLQQACHSLAEAHAAGLVHRDIKPSNIFVARYGLDVDFVKVLDFGLVKQGAKAPQESGLTQEGSVPGTPAYMAPEMALGDGGADPRADVYALGCVAYLLLTGRPVFEGSSPMQMAVKHVHEVPCPVDEAAEQPIPADLSALIMRCLDKDPQKRPETAAALGEALTALATPPAAWSPTLAQRWWRQHHPHAVSDA